MLEAWELVTGYPEGSSAEVFVEKSIPIHVDPEEYKNKFGIVRCE